ncbi:MAG: FAD-dependent oxidoreductase, partial [Candidatus Thermoplasmatota archaeon]|nr:FAD-dependent oxidoreductase [Candidatus Thermoplasmatota archaeon]
MAGNAAAYRLAEKGASVLLVDRARPIGAKNLSGGVIWGHELDKLIPGWYKEAPVERPVTRKGVHFLTDKADFNINFEREEWREEPYQGWIVLRSKTDKWFAEKVEEAGGMVVEGVNVEHVAMEGGRAVGIEQAGETIRANAVIIADGANSRLSIDMGLRKHEGDQIPIEHAALGIKEIIHLGEDVIDERFNVDETSGVAHEYVCGWTEGDVMAGGFLYTNKDTLSLGVVIRLDSLWNQKKVSHDIMEEFRLHPSIAPLLDGGEMVEYGAHLIPEGGVDFIHRRHGPGYMIVGDAAGFCFSNGLMIQGMNYAVGSGVRAADTVLEMKDKGDWSPKAFGGYQKRLEDSYIWKDFERFSGMEDVVWNPRMHHQYPQLIEGIFTEMFTQDETPKEKTRDMVKNKMKELGINPLTLAKDGLTGAKNL